MARPQCPVERKDSSITKISRPGISGVASRERLFCLLDSARELPVVWVSGPAGSGKTTLMASYLDSRQLPCLWYSMDGGDEDMAGFFYYMGLAAKRAVPGKRKPLPLLTPEYLLSVPTFARRYFESLFSRLGTTHTIVFDNYQEVPAGSAFHEMIIGGLEAISPGINVFVLSRSEPPLSFARLRANERIGFLGWEQIRLAPAESREIVEIKGQGKFSDNIVSSLHAISGGWAAGLVLMIESLRSGGNPHHLAGKLPRDEIFNYFAAEIFNKTEKQTHDFLLKTAFLPHLTPRMAEKLTGGANAARILSGLCRGNFFTVKHSAYEDSYQYHPLFREFLQTRSFDLLEPEEIKGIRRTSAKLLEEIGRIEEAVLLFRQAGDMEGLVSLIIKHAAWLTAQGRTQTLLEWIEAVPERLTEGSPWLLYWRGTCLFGFDPAGSLAFFENALEAFKAAGDAAGLFLSWAGAINSMALGSKKVGSLDSWLSMIDDLVTEYGFPSEQVEMQVLSAIFVGATYEPGYHDLEKWVAHALELAQNSRDIALRTQVLYGMALYLMMRRGNLTRASVAVNLLRPIAQFRDASPMVRIAARLTEAVYYEFTALHEPCLTAISDGLKTAGSAGVHIMDYLLLGQAALSALNTGDTAEAGRFITELAATLGNANLHQTAFYHFLSACEALRRNESQQALAHIDMSIQLFADLEIFQGQALNYIAKAQIMHTLGRRKEAFQDLSRAVRIGRRIKSLYIEFSCLLAGAYFSFTKGDEAAGLASLRKVMKLGREQGLYVTFIYLPSALASLCVKALEAGIETEYVQNLIVRCNLSLEDDHFSLFHQGNAGRDHLGVIGQPGRIGIENWPYFLKIYTFGRFQIVREGKPVSFPGKVQQKPLAMLQALIAFGGTEVDAEELSDALWPDAEGDSAHLSFKFTLHRLRKLIGKENVISMQDGKVTLEPRHCFVDVWAFVHLCEQVEEAFKRIAVTGKSVQSGNGVLMKETSPGCTSFASRFSDLAEKAIDFYKGDFLAGESRHSWIFPMRERLKSQFIRIVGLAGGFHEEAGQWEKAVRYYRKALEVNELQEEFYRGIMRCCQKLGRRGEAIAAYSRCRSMLSETLGIEPSKETEALYQRLRREQ